ncbi:MAG: zinc ABC transporter substrate-binding protein [Candidatus Nitrosotenuis sp.]|jgi:zinc transport system substrate-binding protein
MKKPVLGAIGAAIAVVIVVGIMASRPSLPNSPPSDSHSTMIPESQLGKIKVIASFYPLYEFTKNVAGDKAKVSVFVPIGVEPHDWEPSTGDLVALKESHVFVYNGGNMEPFVEKLIASGEYPNVLFVESTHGINLIQTEDAKHASDEHNLPYDPHIWLDPIMAKEQVIAIKNALLKVDADDAQYYEDNANAYLTKLDELDSKIKSELSNCKKDTIVPFHNAFSYFGARYGIKIHALSGITPESEATANDLKQIIDYVKENQIKVIFAEELVDPKLAQVLADEAGAQILILSPLEGITQKEQQMGISYLDKMEENLANIKIALECA